MTDTARRERNKQEMIGGSMHGRACLAAWLIALAATVFLPACARKPPVEPTEAIAASVNPPAPIAKPADPSVTSQPEEEPQELAALPDSILKEIQAISEAQSPEDAVRATKTVLMNAGVVIRQKGVAPQFSASGLSVSEAEVIGMAFEARSRATLSRINFAELSESLTLASGLGMPTTSKDSGNTAEADLIDYGRHEKNWVAFVNDWLAAATKHHDPKDPAAMAVTSPVLYLAALALQQQDPVDLRSPFLARELRLGTLDTVLLLAGLRTALRAADPKLFPIPAGKGLLEGTSTTLAPAVFRLDDGPTVMQVQAPSAECEAFKRSLSGNQQAATDVAGWGAGEGLELALATALNNLGRGGSNWGAIVGPLFDIAGIITKWLSLMELYKPENLKVDVTINPESVHKPTAAQVLALATLKIGVPDERWRELRKKQAEHDVLNLLKGCARSIGMPVPADLGSIGGSIGSWHVKWEIVEGAPTHVVLPGAQFLESGASASRNETQLRATSDHSGEGEVVMEVQKEKKEDHPGIEKASAVVVCGRVRTDEPPSLQTYLNAGWAGATKEALTLLVAISDLLAGMVQNAFTIDACGRGVVTYHVPKGGRWSGVIKTTSDTVRKRMSPASSYQGRTSQSYEEDYTYVVDEIFVRSAAQESGCVEPTTSVYMCGDNQSTHLLAARQYTHGGHLARSINFSTGRGTQPSTNRKFLIGCDFQQGHALEAYGNWSFDTDEGNVTFTLEEDGRYEIVVASYVPDSEKGFEESVQRVDFYEPLRGNDCSEAWRQQKDMTGTGLTLAATPRTTLRGQLNPADPGNKISGRKLIYEGDTKTKITWELTHEGPIRLPSNR